MPFLIIVLAVVAGNAATNMISIGLEKVQPITSRWVNKLKAKHERPLPNNQ